MRILIVKLSSMGDVVQATPAAKAVRKAFPDARIDWLVDKRFADLVEGNPYLENVICLHKGKNPFSGFYQSMKIAKLVRNNRYDMVIDLQGKAKSALAVLASGAKRRIGHKRTREMAWISYNERVPCQDFPHLFRCYEKLLKQASAQAEFALSDMFVPITDRDRRYADEFLKENIGNSPFIACFPATTKPQKHWPVEHWSLLAESIESDYNMHPVFLGASQDIPLIETIIASSKCKNSVNAAGKTTIIQAASIIERASAAVGVDTGLSHIAFAVKCPAVLMFGAWDVWRNFENEELVIALHENLDCSPCYRNPICSDYKCMQMVTPRKVLDSLDSLLQKRGIYSYLR